jgi:hypothetical protein
MWRNFKQKDLHLSPNNKIVFTFVHAEYLYILLDNDLSNFLAPIPTTDMGMTTTAKGNGKG